MSSELDRSYAESGFNQRLGFGRRPVLLVIDFVKAYLTPGNPLYAGVEDELAAAAVLLGAARTAGIPVIFTTVHYDDGAEGGQFFRKVRGLQNFVGDTPGATICDELAPLDGEPVIRKQFASAFFGTSLHEDLTALGADSVLVCGLSTSGCVRASAIDAVQHDYIPLVVREAVGDRAPGPHEASLFDLDAKYADVIGLEAALEHLASLPPRP